MRFIYLAPLFFVGACATATETQVSSSSLKCAPDAAFQADIADKGARVREHGPRGEDHFTWYQLPDGRWFIARSKGGTTCIMANGDDGRGNGISI